MHALRPWAVGSMRKCGVRFRTNDAENHGLWTRQDSTLADDKTFRSALMAMLLFLNAGGPLPACLFIWPEKTFQINTTLASLQFANKYFKHLAMLEPQNVLR